MTLKRIFISHSANKDESARAALGELETRLGTVKDRFGVLLDRSTLVATEEWRSALNVWCGVCDAAILLVTKDSIVRDFCVYEWSILGYRRMLSPAFTILPIFLGTTPEDLRGKPQQIQELQGITYTTIEEIWPRIEEWLDKVVSSDGPTMKQVRLIASLFRKHLSDPRGKLVEDSLQKVGERLGTWEPLLDPQEQFALKLTELGLKRAAPVLIDLQWAFDRDEGAWADVVNLVKSSWVDDRSASALYELSSGSSTKRAIALNASEVRTGRLYVVKACGRPPSYAWCTAEVTDVVDSPEGLEAQIWVSLAGVLGLDPTTESEKVRKRLAAKQLTGQPVIVCLSTRPLDPKWLSAVRGRFDSVTFLLLSGSEKPQWPDVQWMEPELAPGFETTFWRWYEEVESEFTPR